MKFGTTIMTYASNFGPIVYKDGNILENIREFSALGYTCVDLFLPKSTKEELIATRKIFDDNNIEITTYLPRFLGEFGVSLCDSVLEDRLKAVEVFKKEIDNAKVLGAGSISLGLFRGNLKDGENYDQCIARMADSVKVLDEYSLKVGVRINLEPINRYEMTTLNSAEECLKFIKDNQYKNVGLLLDIFHMNIEDKDIVSIIKQAGSLIGNMHMADSNRYASGMGHMDYKAILSALKSVNYQGALTIEAFPEPTPKACSEKSINTLKKALQEV